jgi:hypothetical protein
LAGRTTVVVVEVVGATVVEVELLGLVLVLVLVLVPVPRVVVVLRDAVEDDGELEQAASTSANSASTGNDAHRVVTNRSLRA